MPSLSRRTLILGGAAIAGGVTLMSKPSDESGPRDPYYLDLQKALIDAAECKHRHTLGAFAVRYGVPHRRQIASLSVFNRAYPLSIRRRSLNDV